MSPPPFVLFLPSVLCLAFLPLSSSAFTRAFPLVESNSFKNSTGDSLAKDLQMDSVYNPPSSGANDFQAYEYDDSSGRVRKVSQSRERILGVKKNTFFGALFGICVVAVCVGATMYFVKQKRTPSGAVGAITTAFTGQYCRTDKDCVTPGAECFLEDDIIDDESPKAKNMRGICEIPTATMKHCKDTSECIISMECVVKMESFRGECVDKVATKPSGAPMPTATYKVLRPKNTRRRMNGKLCCKAYTASCLACSRGVSVDQYCAAEKHGHVPGCPEHSHDHGRTMDSADHDHDHTPGNDHAAGVNDIVGQEKRMWKESKTILLNDPFEEDEIDGSCHSPPARVVLDKTVQGGRRLATYTPSGANKCTYLACDVPENRDKFANVEIAKPIPVEFIVVTDEAGNYPARKTTEDIEHSIATLNQAYEQTGISFTGAVRTVASNDLYLASVTPEPSYKARLESSMTQIKQIGSDAMNIMPVKALRQLPGEFDWQYMRPGDVLHLHRLDSMGFSTNLRLMEQSGLSTDVAAPQRRRSLLWGGAVSNSVSRRRHNDPFSRRPASTGHMDRVQRIKRSIRRSRRKQQRIRKRMRKFMLKRLSREYVMLLHAFAKLQRLNKRLISEKNDALNRAQHDHSGNIGTTTAPPSEDAPSAPPQNVGATKLKVSLVQCATCMGSPGICQMVPKETSTPQDDKCAVVKFVETTVDGLASGSGVEFKPAAPGFYYLKIEGNIATPFNVQFDVKMDGSCMSDEEIISKLGLRESPAAAKTLQVYVFNMAVDSLLGWAYHPYGATPLQQGGMVMNAYRLTAGSSTLPHELGHALGLWHTFHGTKEQGAYDQDGETVFRGEDKAAGQMRRESSLKALLYKDKTLRPKSAAENQLADMKDERTAKKLMFDEDPLGYSPSAYCPQCVEHPDAPDTQRDRVGDFCSDTRPIPKQHECNNPDETVPVKHTPICGASSWKETPYNNLMSYGKDWCRSVLTKQQSSRMKCYLHSIEKLAHIAGLKHIPDVSTFVAPKPGATLDVDEEVQEGVAEGTIVDDIEEMGHPLSIDQQVDAIQQRRAGHDYDDDGQMLFDDDEDDVFADGGQ